AHDVDYTFERAVVMRAGLGIGMDADRPGPEPLCAGAGEINRGLALHARRLRRIRVERVAGDDAHAVMLPPGFGHFLAPGILYVAASPRSRFPTACSEYYSNASEAT